MFDYNPDPSIFEHYLRLLGIPKQEPSYKFLSDLVVAQMTRIPFENISKLYYLKLKGMRTIPDLNLYLDGIEFNNFGGTCYSNNYYLHLLLKYLGFDVILCGADMANPDVHMVNLVNIDGHEFIVDVGYAAPFLSPLPRDLKEDYVLKWGQDRYVLKPKDANGNSQMELHRNGEHKHGYLVKPIPRQIEHFKPIIEDSYRASATFMNSILIVRFFRNRSVVLHNMSIIESERGSSILIILKDRDEILGTIKDRFSIPREIAAVAISEIKEFGDAWN